MRALANDGATASRQEPPCTTPEELAKAVAAMPRVRPPEPTFAAQPVYQQPAYQRTTYQQGTYGRPSTTPSSVTQPVLAAPPAPLQSRTGRVLKWGVSALLIAALGLGSWQLAEILLDQRKGSDDPGVTQPTDDEKPPPAPPKPLTIAGATEFMPDGSGIQPGGVPNAVDGDSTTAWITNRYLGFANFGNLPQRRQGSGIIVDLGKVQDVRSIDIDMYRSGQTTAVFAADPDTTSPSSSADFPQRIAEKQVAGKTLKQELEKPVRTRYVLIHITELPADGTGGYRGGITDISVLG